MSRKKIKMNERPMTSETSSDPTPYKCRQVRDMVLYCNHDECRPAESDWPCLDEPPNHGGRCFHAVCRPAPLPTAVRPPAPPARRLTRLPDADQIIRAEALRCATTGGPRDPEAAIRDAKRYAEWIKNG